MINVAPESLSEQEDIQNRSGWDQHIDIKEIFFTHQITTERQEMKVKSPAVTAALDENIAHLKSIN